MWELEANDEKDRKRTEGLANMTSNTGRKHRVSCLFHWVAFGLAATLTGTSALGDWFGEGDNRFEISFVTIAGDASSANGTSISQYAPGVPGYRTFADPGHNYRIGVYEITNGQWNTFASRLGVPVTGTPSGAYEEQDDTWFIPADPMDEVSWLEAAQFVNWLNTSTGHHAAYKFTGTQGQSNYTFTAWSASEAAGGGTNLYRHKDAFYFLPTEDEWVKAAYWNGTTLQNYATSYDGPPFEADWDVRDAGWNFLDTYRAWDWAIGYGSTELNGTHDMMGNLAEWTESPYDGDTSDIYGQRTVRGGDFASSMTALGLTYRSDVLRYHESEYTGFRVAAMVPEPATLGLLALGGLALIRRRRA